MCDYDTCVAVYNEYGSLFLVIGFSFSNAIISGSLKFINLYSLNFLCSLLNSSFGIANC